MKYVWRYWDTFLLLMFIWCVLNEDFHWTTLSVAIFMSGMTIFLNHILSLDYWVSGGYHLSPYLLLAYIFLLFYQIIRSAFTVILSILSKRVNPTILQLETHLHQHWFQCLIANSITLTPGTVTIDKSDTHLTILWLYPTTDDPSAQAKQLFGPFERLLEKGVIK